MEESLKDQCNKLRTDVLNLSKRVFALKACGDVVSLSSMDELPGKSEIMANIMLAYRHLEDARMRIGKIMEPYDGGEAICGDERVYG